MTIGLPASIVLERGSSTNLTCLANGDPTPNYQWYKSGQLLTTTQVSLDDGNKTLILTNVTMEDDGVYTCEAYNVEGNVTSSTRLAVHGG